MNMPAEDSVMNDEEITLYASHHQFYVQDRKPKGSSDDPEFWTEAATEDRLAVGDGLLAIGTSTYGFVKVRVEEHDSEPQLEMSNWDHITECGLKVNSGMLLVAGCLARSGLYFEVKPGNFRIRACHADLALSEDESPANRPDFGDWYLIQFWPSETSTTQILKHR